MIFVTSKDICTSISLPWEGGTKKHYTCQSTGGFKVETSLHKHPSITLYSPTF